MSTLSLKDSRNIQIKIWLKIITGYSPEDGGIGGGSCGGGGAGGSSRGTDKHKNKFLVVSFLDAFANLRKATIGFVVSVHASAWNKSALTGLIFVNFDA